MRNAAFILAIVFLLKTNVSNAQEPYPNSIVNIGLGVGQVYGGIGVKTVIGYKSSGLLLGIGKFGPYTGYQIGVQLSLKWWFISFGYGVNGFEVVKNAAGSTISESKLIGGNMMTGCMINLEKSKRLFLDLGIGFIGGKTPKDFFGRRLDYIAFTGLIGIGYRIGGYIIKP